MEGAGAGPSLKLQKSVRDNTEALHDFLADLKSWEKEMKAVDAQLSSQASGKNGQGSAANPSTPPVRSRQVEGATSPTKGATKQGEKSKQTKQKENKQMASSSSSNNKIKKACDYAAWDKFDVDKALESPEEEEEEQEHKEPKSPTAGRNPRASKKERANTLKEEGNKLYGRGRLEDAVAKYTQGMALDPTNALLPGNRAMAYIKLKKFTAAEADCNRCLKLDCNYIKGFLRRATARLSLGKEELARRDYLKVLEMEPHNKEARKGLDELNRPSGSQGEETRSNTEQQQHTPDTNERLTAVPEPTRESTTVKDTAATKNTPLRDSAPVQNTAPKPSGETEREGTASRMETGGKASTETTAIKRTGSGKKVKIVEVDSSSTASVSANSSTTTNVNATSSSTILPAKVANQIFPVDKPPHLRSKKPLQRIPVKDVASREEIEKERVEATLVREDGSGKSDSGSSKGDSGGSSKGDSGSSKGDSGSNKGDSGSSKGDSGSSKGDSGQKESKKTEKPAAPLEMVVLVGGRATVPTVPKTSHQFSQDWHRLYRTPDAACEYLKMIPVTFFRTVDLETNTLVEVAEVLTGEGVSAAQAAQYLSALSVSHGFSISLMFLEADQKQVFLNLITKCKQVEDHAAKMEELEATISSL